MISMANEPMVENSKIRSGMIRHDESTDAGKGR